MSKIGIGGIALHLKVMSKRLSYELEFFGKYTVIQGDSGTGKTTLCTLLDSYANGNHAVKVECEFKVYHVVSTMAEMMLENIHDSILVIDEDCKILRSYNIANMLKQSNNYFILISRHTFDFLPLSIENLYTLHVDGKNHALQHTYTLGNKRTFFDIELIVTEDRKSGYEFFKHHFNIPVQSAGSKSQIVPTLNRLFYGNKKLSRILVVFDAAAFAYQYKSLCEWVAAHRSLNVSFLDWQSFENYILRQPPFSIVQEQQDTDNYVESLEQLSTDTLESIINYNKDTLCKCLTQNVECGRCSRVHECKYKHNCFQCDLKIIGKNNLMEVF